MATGDDIVRVARAQIGKPYVFATAGPNTFDCSGLVVYCFKQVTGKSYPHFTGALVNYGTPVAKTDLAVGDLVFPDSGHVQIYSGNGKVVEAPHTGAKVREVPMWGFWRARRLITPGSGSGSGPTPAVTVGNPVSDVKGLLDAFSSINQAVQWFTDPYNWERIILFIGGGLLTIFAIARLGGGSASGVVDTAKAFGKGVSQGAKS